MLEQEQFRKPISKLRKQLKRFPADPRPEEVHSLRTQIRRIEALATYLLVDSKHTVRRLLKTLEPLRKAAGRVRDLDVLIADVLMLESRKDDGSTVQLVAHLAMKRIKKVKTLRKVIIDHGDEARSLLKKSAKLIYKRAEESSWTVPVRESAPKILVNELSYWPRLNAENLHPFRIKVKELRNMLQFDGVSNRGRIGTLGEVKDAIGEWHDWTELLNIAREVIGDAPSSPLLEKIRDTAQAKLQPALSVANLARKKYFHPG